MLENIDKLNQTQPKSNYSVVVSLVYKARVLNVSKQEKKFRKKIKQILEG